MVSTIPTTPVLEARDIYKRFAGVVALDGVSIVVSRAKVHAVVGENGAGKSTLIKTLSGVHRPDSGELLVDGKPVKFGAPSDAEALGIAVIHQELNLVPALTVAENIFLGRELHRFGFVDKALMQEKADELLNRLSHPLDVTTPVSRLKISDQQIVEIAKALSLNARVLIMDEPTTALASADVEKLFVVIRTLIAEGTGIVYISHKMDELFAIADEFTVLRDGKFISHCPASETNPAELVRQMVGRDITHTRGNQPATEADELLRVENLTSVQRDALGRPRLRNISFTLHQGEILGIAGLMGAGRTEMLESLFGTHPISKDSRITLDGQKISVTAPKHAIKHGIAMVSEDRKGEGLVLGLDVGSNITLAKLTAFTRMGFVNKTSETRTAWDWVNKLSIKTPDIRTKTSNLSGGNQQKIVLAKWLLTQPRVLLLDEPTKGIDIGGKAEIYRLIEELAQTGIGIVLVSSELPELLALSDRIIIIREGEVAGVLSRDEATEERIMEFATIGGEAYVEK